jgi:hypothetical protein
MTKIALRLDHKKKPIILKKMLKMTNKNLLLKLKLNRKKSLKNRKKLKFKNQLNYLHNLLRILLMIS